MKYKPTLNNILENGYIIKQTRGYAQRRGQNYRITGLIFKNMKIQSLPFFFHLFNHATIIVYDLT